LKEGEALLFPLSQVNFVAVKTEHDVIATELLNGKSLGNFEFPAVFTPSSDEASRSACRGVNRWNGCKARQRNASSKKRDYFLTLRSRGTASGARSGAYRSGV
jgi:hypothetical protein